MCVSPTRELQILSFQQYLHVDVSSLVRKMEADMSVQFFVKNIHLHEEGRVKNLICKAIWRVDRP